MSFDWNLENTFAYSLVARFEFDGAFTSCTPDDRRLREIIREFASRSFPVEVPQAKWWAFRVVIQREGTGPFDLDNALKLVVDSFGKRQILRDASAYPNVGLFPDDTIDSVRMMQIAGTPVSSQEKPSLRSMGL
jgi:hypothetical protein